MYFASSLCYVRVILSDEFTADIFSSLLTRIEEVCSFTDKEQSRRIVSGLRWLGLLSFEQATVVGRRPLDTLCGQLKKLMTYQSGQRDLVLLFNKVVIHWKKGKPVCISGPNPN